MLEQIFRIISAWFLLDCSCCILGALPIEHVTCVLPYITWSHREYLEVSWRLPTGPLDQYGGEQLPTIVNWWTATNSGRCNHVTVTSCRWYAHNDDQAMYFGHGFTWNVTIATDTKTIAVGQWYLDPLTCVKPPAPDMLKVLPSGSTCMNVDFGYSQQMDCNPVFNETYQVLWKSADNSTYKIQLVNASCNYSIRLCNLSPFTRYDVGVACMKQGSEDVAIGQWSDVAMATNTTKQDIPADSPAMTPGGLQYDSTDCRTNSSRGVTIYWKQLDASKRNGVILGYRLTVRNTSGAYGYDVADGSATSLGVRLQCNSSCRVELIARTVAGFSEIPSLMPIEMYRESPTVNVIPEIDYDRQEVEVSWSHDTNTTGVTGWTIFWCSKDSLGHCKSHVGWSVIRRPVQTATVPFPAGSSAIHHYKYGVSLQTAAGNSPITWQRCLFLWNGDLVTPQSVRFREYGNPNGLVIEWENPACAGRTPGPYIDHFLIQYCETEHSKCKGENTSIQVNGRANHVELNDVTADVRLGVTVTAVGRDGERSIPSDMVIGGLHIHDGLPRTTVALLIISAMVLILLAGLGTVPIVRKIKGMYRAPIIEDIYIPEIQVSNVLNPFNTTYLYNANVGKQCRSR